MKVSGFKSLLVDQLCSATRQPLENGISKLTKTARFQVLSDSPPTVARRCMNSYVHSVVKWDRVKNDLSEKAENIEPFYYQLMHIMLKNTELLKHSKITP